MIILQYPDLKTYSKKNELLDKLSNYISIGNLDFIEKIIVASNENYGNAIIMLDSNSTYTNNRNNIGIAKTIGKIIIIKDYVLDNFINNFDNAESHFTIFHEFGHSKDNSIRTTSNLETLSRPFSVDNVTKYYSSIILDEFAANMFASNFITDSIFDSLYLNKCDDLQNTLNGFSSYHRSLNEDDKFNLSGDIWILIYKLLEIYSLAFFLKKIHKVLLPKELKRMRLKKLLKSLYRRYPNWNNIDNKNLEKLWWRILHRVKINLI